jgi:hypothetical protein
LIREAVNHLMGLETSIRKSRSELTIIQSENQMRAREVDSARIRVQDSSTNVKVLQDFVEDAYRQAHEDPEYDKREKMKQDPSGFAAMAAGREVARVGRASRKGE